MCGICGQFNFRTRQPVEAETIHRMSSSIVHRGPDDDGFFFDGELGFGFRRLSIIDLAGGHQPMSDAEESVWVVFNGEIYNYPELKQELQADGFRFRTQSDTEVIVHGYKKWGLDVFNHLNGMFGLAIWDVARKRLVLSRDAFGIKLIYYKLDDRGLSFGSEIRAVRAASDEKTEIDPVSLNLFLRYRFTPSPFTVYRGIRKLAPGTMLIAEAGAVRVERWYKFKPTPFSRMPSDAEAREELLAIYRRAMKRHLLSDVPVGLLLSGGLDSGLLLALMNERGDNWPTFTIGYGSTFKDDELEDAARTANVFGAKHTSILIDQNKFEDSLPHIVSCLEEPVAASSIVPMYFVSERARQTVKVALNGQGPDELFGGYKRHLGVRYGQYWAGLPQWLRNSVSAGIQALPRNETLKRATYSLHVEDRLRRYQQVLSIAPEETIDGLFHDGLLPRHSGDKILDAWSDLYPLIEDSDELSGFQFLEIHSTLPDELLMYADKLSMAHSLEVRVPYLDREVVEYVQQLSPKYKVRNGTRKWLHRQVCKSFLPAEIHRRPKRGFGVNVVDDWIRSASGRVADSLREGSALGEIIRPDAVKALLRRHVSGEADNHKLLFSLAVCEQWLRSTQDRPESLASV
jgi:asparagine synthase (glutamine-hydrolysing)